MYIADLHIHSRYSRATSRELTPETLELSASLHQLLRNLHKRLAHEKDPIGVGRKGKDLGPQGL